MNINMNKRGMPFFLVGIALLTGCAGAKSDFECNATSSDSCMTIDAANNMARMKSQGGGRKAGCDVVARPG